MATRVKDIERHSEIDRPPKYPTVQKSKTYLTYKLIYSKFCVKIFNFLLHGNKGWSDTDVLLLFLLACFYSYCLPVF